MNRIKIYSFLILCFAIVGISKAQNVGVGTTTPQNKLHVKGQMRVDTLTSGSLTADSIVLVGTNGLFKKAQYNAVADQSLGSISVFAFSAIPTDYLECNGAAVSRTTYAALFAKIGTTYGAGNGSTTFNVPDLRGEFIRGWSNGKVGVDIGRTLGSNQGDAILQTTSNVIAVGAMVGTITNNGVYGSDGSRWGIMDDANDNPPSTFNQMSVTIGSGTETRPRNVAMVYAIKAIESVLLPTATSTAVTTAAIANEPWFNVATGTQATANTQNIYQMGNVGIGTTSPLRKLQIAQNVGSNEGLSITTADYVHGTTGTALIFRSSAISGNTDYELRVNQSGGVTSGGNLLINPSGGNVGIGTTAPTKRLHIDNGTTAGAIRIVDGTQGAGKVLTSDANGVGTWTSYGSYSITVAQSGQMTSGNYSASIGTNTGVSFNFPKAGVYSIKIPIYFTWISGCQDLYFYFNGATIVAQSTSEKRQLCGNPASDWWNANWTVIVNGPGVVNLQYHVSFGVPVQLEIGANSSNAISLN